MFFKRNKSIDIDHIDRSKFVTVVRGLWMSPVDLAGEFLDLSTYWRRTRRWGAIFAILPVAIVAVVLGSFVAAGKMVTDSSKVEWYAERANDEIAKTEPASTGSEASKQPEEGSSSKRLPEVIDMLYRRVLQLNKNNKLAKFYVANQMTRYGSRGSARQIMESLAPIQTSGYPRAHAWLAMDLIERGQKGESINLDTLKYHLKRGTSGDDAAPSLLFAYSQLLQQENKPAESQEYLKKAAQAEPQLLLNSINTYMQNGLPAQAAATADLLVEKVKDKTSNPEENIVLAAQAYAFTDRIDKALEVLQTGMKRFPKSTILSRAISNAFRQKFRMSSTNLNNQVQVNLEFLNAAIAFDPTNVSIQDELNALAQLGIGQSDAAIEALRVQIATSGTSFAARLLLAESSFRRGEILSAINDYEVILAELPKMTLALNNLAMLYTLVVPPRLEEAIQLIDRAISIGPTVAEFHDSRGDILALLKRKEEAINSYLLSLEKSPTRVETREKLIGLYEELSQPELAKAQRDKLAEVQQAIELQRSKMKEAQEQATRQKEAATRTPETTTPVPEDPDKANEEVTGPKPANEP